MDFVPTKAGHPKSPDRWLDVATELAWAACDRGGHLAVAHVGAQTQDAGRDRADQQNGPPDMGDSDKE